jgi:hypothetical protein
MVKLSFQRGATNGSVDARISRAVANLGIPRPEFSISVGWASTYDDLFAGRFLSTSDISQLVSTALAKGFVLLTGRGGGAKTVIVHRLAQYSLQRQLLPLVITLKDWTGRDYEDWDRIESQFGKIEFLLRRFGLASVQSIDLDEMPLKTIRLLLVDGLNEVNSRTGQEIIYALDEYVRYAPSARLIVTDRLLRRAFVDPNRWQLALVKPLSSNEVKKQISSRFHSGTYSTLSAEGAELLESPYFLNAFLRDGQIAKTRSEEFWTYFTRHAALSEAEVDSASVAAFNAYRVSSRTFNLDDFVQVSSDIVVQKLEHAGAIIREGSVAYFDHHLKHDYLASKYLATRRGEWNPDTFRHVTFSASSFETMSLTLEQIVARDDADYFLRQVYDWNPYGAGYAIAEARQSAATREMHIVIFSMLAERRWDIMVQTSERAADTLNLIRTDDARRFQATNDLNNIFAIISAVQSEYEWFREWRTLYTKPPQSRATEADIRELAKHDSVTGWTAANVLKRLQLGDELQDIVRNYLRDHDAAVVRWRAAHVLGSQPTRQNMEVLVFALKDRDSAVRFGATRSLIEVAARNAELTTDVFKVLIENTQYIVEHRHIVEEVQRAVFVKREYVPRKWTSAVLPLIAVLQAKTTSAYRAEQWDRVVKGLVTNYGTS